MFPYFERDNYICRRQHQLCGHVERQRLHPLRSNPNVFIRHSVAVCPTVCTSVLQPNKRILTMASNLDLDSIYQFAIQLGKDAGKLLQDAAQRRMSGEDQMEEVEKLNSVDIVTKTDEGEGIIYRDCRLCSWRSLLT